MRVCKKCYMRKIGLTLLLLSLSVIGISQTDSIITEKQYWHLYFPNGREPEFKYVNLFAGKGRKTSNFFSYFEYDGKFKLAMFDSVNFIKEITFREDVLFESIIQNIDNILKFTKSKRMDLFNGVTEYNDTIHFRKNLAIRVLPLHCNHFKFYDQATLDKVNDEEMKVSCMVINQIINFIEKKFNQ